jgi:hypothetical protein
MYPVDEMTNFFQDRDVHVSPLSLQGRGQGVDALRKRAERKRRKEV